MRQSSFLLAAIALASLSAIAVAQTATDPLAAGFRNPPEAARPRTWWHWTNGNVTEAGITKDLEWMKRSGIGGFQLVDVASGGGQTVEPKIHFGTEEWYRAVRHSAEEAKRLGLEMSIFSCAGWSEAGGPWVTQSMAMKKLVWSETHADGPAKFSGQLPEPPSNEGPVRDASARPDGPHFYRDSAVIAYRTPQDATPIKALHPRVTASSGAIDAAPLLDDSLNTSVTIPAPKDGSPAWLQFEFAQRYTARALSFGAHGRIPVGKILASDDGTAFHSILDMPGPQGYHGASIRTFTFPATTARFFRIELDGAGLTPAAVIHGGPVVAANAYTVTEAILFSDARINRWEDKGAFGSLMDVYDVVPTPAAPDSAVIARKDVIDLTSHMKPDGTLDWEVPAGHWTVLRMGYSLTGAKNRPSVPAGSGYEVDKLSADYVRQYFSGYVDPLQKHLGSLLGSTPHYMTMDSWEAGMQNWTDEMIAQFTRRRGYDPRPYLPALAGRVVGSADVSDRFLWDFRRTLADMYADEFYGTMTDELHKRGMEDYSEASGVALELPEDTLLNKSKVDIPMAEFWVHALHPESMYYVDVRGAASSAHVYGKPIVAAESFTGGGYESPFTLKKIADYWFTQGINRLVFHTSAQQPLDTPPGNTMVGTHLNRNITWAEQAKPFMDYVARVSYMLQQGSPVADLAYLLPEGAPSTMPFWGAGLEPAPPAGYDYDYINTDILLHHTSVDADGRLQLDSGVKYRLLVLPPTTQMTPEVLRKLHELVAAGASISGPRPTASPSLANYPASDEEVNTLASDLWADMDGVTKNQHSLGKGMVYSGLALNEILTRLHVEPDFSASGSPENPPAWIHRHLADADVYFVVNQSDRPESMEARLRVAGKSVQLWRPMEGSLINASYTSGAPVEERSGNRQPGLQPAVYVAQADFTSVPLNLAAREALFIVVRNTAQTPPVVSSPVSQLLASLHGPWTVTFPAHLGAPASVQLSKLSSWTESEDPGVKFFSGTATYSTTFAATAEILHRRSAAGKHIVLHFENVRDIAAVKLNGKSTDLTWAPPYEVDVTDAIRPGVNKLEIAVTNEWTNRILGDRALPAGQKILPDVPPSRPGAPVPGLPESGLIGNVTLLSVTSVD
ncbi:glycosyl hydrolase [Granulicella mallensis]|uniref:Glycoside hydrolase family 2 sugar binding protein n=1 Tax=Granulicella mallensis (strain ATCC BAA-1857 / DSM 23137 / MP5ACTX8) TaxID=682795 RepID=G8NTJ8_GRAMM|nr:glycosyl hydrolase [Granulicella mallensis]AEU35230.1 glycoside hydrolase family 2 sugar binding protein [Granulicella mallensis MP5ACTX8]